MRGNEQRDSRGLACRWDYEMMTARPPMTFQHEKAEMSPSRPQLPVGGSVIRSQCASNLSWTFREERAHPLQCGETTVREQAASLYKTGPLPIALSLSPFLGTIR